MVEKEQQKICPNFKFSNFATLLTTLVETLPRTIHELWENTTPNRAKSPGFSDPPATKKEQSYHQNINAL